MQVLFPHPAGPVMNITRRVSLQVSQALWLERFLLWRNRNWDLHLEVGSIMNFHLYCCLVGPIAAAVLSLSLVNYIFTCPCWSYLCCCSFSFTGGLSHAVGRGDCTLFVILSLSLVDCHMPLGGVIAHFFKPWFYCYCCFLFSTGGLSHAVRRGDCTLFAILSLSLVDCHMPWCDACWKMQTACWEIQTGLQFANSDDTYFFLICELWCLMTLTFLTTLMWRVLENTNISNSDDTYFFPMQTGPQNANRAQM